MSDSEAITGVLENFSLEIPKKITGLVSSQLLIFQRLNTQSRQIHRDRKQISGCHGLEAERSGYGVSSWGDENNLELDSGDGCTIY